MKILAWTLVLWMALPAFAAADSGLPAYNLHFDEKSMRRLLAYRERIRELDFLGAQQRQWIPATFVHTGQRYEVRVRMRGDLPVHWRGSRQSYRLKFKGGLFQGRKEINLIVPWDKHYAVEWLQTRVAEDLGLLAFPGRFVDLSINGQPVGLYYESEHPTREYLERHGRMPSSIFTFGANWTFFFGQAYHHIAFELPGSATSPPVESLAQIKQRRTYDRNDPDLARMQLGYMVEFYELLTEGSVEDVRQRAPDFLDLGKFVRYVALQNFFGSTHGMALNDNSRLYLDPSSGKFEFIPWDIALWSLSERASKRNVEVAELLVPENPVFRKLFRAIPGLREARDEVLMGLLARGEEYRQILDDRHAELMRLAPQEERLPAQRERHDSVFRENLALLASALSAERASTPDRHGSL